jgi:hypothetical protein
VAVAGIADADADADAAAVVQMAGMLVGVLRERHVESAAPKHVELPDAELSQELVRVQV